MNTKLNAEVLALSITNPKEEVVTMNSHEIALITGKNHDHVKRDIKSMLDKLYPPTMEVLDYKGVFIHYKHYNGRNVIDHIDLDRLHTECLLTGYDVGRRMKVLKRLIELEKDLKGNLIPNFNDPVTAARAWADEKEKTQILAVDNVEKAKLIEIMKPKEEFHDTVVSAKRGVTVEIFAKECGVGRNKMFKWLRDNGYLQSNNIPFQRYITTTKWFEVTKVVKQNQYGDKVSDVTKVTGLGQAKLINKMIVDGFIRKP